MFFYFQQSKKKMTNNNNVIERDNTTEFIKTASKSNKSDCYNHFNMKRFWILFGVTAGIFVILFILACTIDFDISWGLANNHFKQSWTYGSDQIINYYSNNAWDNLIECIGDAPAYLLLPFAFWLISFSFFKKVNNQQLKIYRQIAQVIIPLFLMMCSVWFITQYNWKADGLYELLKITNAQISDSLLLLCSILISLVINSAFALIIWKFAENVQMSLIKIGFIFIILFIICDTTMWALKTQCGINRERFRALMTDPRSWNLVEVGNSTLDKSLVMNNFHPWWSATDASYKTGWAEGSGTAAVFINARQGGSLGNAFSSFPSWHTTDVAYIMTLCFLPCCIRKTDDQKWKGYFIWALMLIIVLIVMFSRVSAGAHYLSDTVFGLLITLVPIVILGTIFCKIDKVRKWFDTSDINGHWYQFTFLPVLLPLLSLLLMLLLTW